MRRAQGNAMEVNVPSPLVGEGYTASRQQLAWVRGTLSTIPMRRQPLTPRRGAAPPPPPPGGGGGALTRLRFAKPPSPTRGEGAGAAVRSYRTP